jgi:predicted ATPase
VGNVEIRLLGGFEAAVDGVPAEDRWRLRKARELAKLLALARGHRLHREQVMEALWPERSPIAAANNLNQVVHVARRVLGPDAVATQGELLELVAEVDVDEFERAAAEARRTPSPAAYRRALELYGGELLPENRYDDWCAARREELDALHAELTGELDRLPADSSPPARRLPADSGSFVGRTHELAELRSLLIHTRLLTLIGTGGSGKTRLALALARDVEPSFADGAALAELDEVSDRALVPNAVAAALDVRALTGRPLVESLVDFLGTRELLLVLDNCEHLLAESAALVETLLGGAPRLTIVATSREPLRIPAEVVFRVPSLDIPDPEQSLAPKDLLRFAGVRLLVERASASAPGFTLDRSTAPHVARICFRLDGLPLALELAAGRLGALGAAAVAERLDDRFLLLRAGSRTAPTRQQTLAATLQWSHDLLDEDEAALYRRLAVFNGGFGVEAMEEVCNGGLIERAGVIDLLARLVEKSLVAVESLGEHPRYRLLETIRADARLRLVEAGEADELAGRHARWALALAEARGGSAALDREEANLAAALDTLLAADPQEALRLCTALWPFWLRRIELAEAGRRFERALELAPERTPRRAVALHAAAITSLRAGMIGPAVERADESLELARALGDADAEWQALQFLGGTAVTDEDPAAGLRLLEEALALARREHFAAREALGTYSLGTVAWLAGDLERAEALMVEGLDALRALGDSNDRIPAPVNLTEVLLEGSHLGPRVLFEETRQPFYEVTPRQAAGYVLGNLVYVERARGDFARARVLIDEAAALFELDGDDRGAADVLSRRAFLELLAGRPAEAERAFLEALELRRRLNDRRGVGLVLSGLGHLATTQGDHEAAERYLAESRAIFRRAGDRWGLTGALWRTADLALVRGRPEEAEAALEEARTTIGETGHSRWLAQTLVGLAEAAELQGDVERAASLRAVARERLAERGGSAVARAIDARLVESAKPAQTGRKAPGDTTPSTRTAKGRTK